MRLIGYIRVSTNAQAESGLGLDAQRDVITRFAASGGHSIVGWEIDAGESGKSLDRPALQRALLHLESGGADGLAIAALDRLTRSVVDLMNVTKRINDAGWQLLCAREHIDTTSPTGRLVLTILGVIAEWEREQCSHRTKAALAAKRARGECLGGKVPYGLRKEGRRYVAEPAEQALIAVAVELYAQGLTLGGVAREMNERGLRARSGAKFAPAHISRMLRPQKCA